MGKEIVSQTFRLNETVGKGQGNADCGLVIPANRAVRYLVHSGNSMCPTLCERDLIEVMPCTGRTARVGDAVVFKSPAEDILIVHRIVMKNDQGMVTRGDNNASNDPWTLQPDAVQGLAVAAWREGKRRKIIGGRKGFLSARLKWAFRQIRHRPNKFFCLLYGCLAQKGILQKMVPVTHKLRIVIFKGDKGNISRLMLGRHVLGIFNERRGQWYIKRPFKFFVNKKIRSCHPL